MADRIKGITIEIGGDTTGLSKALGGVNKEIRSTQSQLKDVERLLKLDPKNTELLSQKQKLLTKSIEDTKDKLDTLKTAEKQVQQQFDEGKINQQQYDALKREIIDTENRLNSLTESAKKNNDALSKITAVGDKFQEVGGKISSVGKKLLPVSAAVAGIGTASIVASDEIDKGYDIIVKKTGAVGDTLDGLKKTADNVFSELPITIEESGTAIGEVNTRFGVTGDKLEDLSTKFIKFAKINDADVNQSIQLVSRAMGDAGIKTEDAGEFLDKLTTAAQMSGISIETLTENVTKYGAPMRALGFDTKESISIFAAWEKAGVNTEIAFSGMKAAIGKWGKEGKDARKEFGKTLKDIKSAPNIADATAKAIEVFGQKAGPDLADAIQGGRFEYEDFLKALDGSKGIVESTFEGIKHPSDDAKVSLNNLKLAGAELGRTMLTTLQPTIKSIVGKIKELTSWFRNLNQSQKDTILKIGAVAGVLPVLLTAIGKVSSGIGALVKITLTLGKLFTVLSGAGGPILLAVVAVAALSAIFFKLKGKTENYREEAKKLTEQEQENKTKIEELSESYQSMNKQRQESTGTILAETQHEQDLLKELESITDENGNIKSGYEDRARFITGELSNALGVEIKMTGSQIQNYKDMANEIDNLIAKKQANALLEANQQGYTDAIKNQTDAYMEYKQAQTDVADTTKKLTDAQKELDKEVQLLSETNNPFYDWRPLEKAKDTVEGYSDKIKELKQTLSDSEDAYVGYNTTIKNYEGLSSAIISGDQDKIKDAITQTANEFKTVETATKDSLERQVQTYTDKYTEMKKAVEEGAPGITQAQVDEMKKLVDQSKLELDKLPKEATKVGTDFSAGLTQGMTAGKGNIIAVATELAAASIKAARTELDSHSPSRVMDGIGQDFGSGFANGIISGKGGVVSNVVSIVDTIKSTITSLPSQAITWGSDLIGGLIQGINSKIGDITKSIKGVADTITSYLHFSRPDIGPLREYEKWMPDMVKGMASGIKDNAWRITDQLKGITGNMSYALNGDISATSGSDLTKIEGLLNNYLPGMNSGSNIVLDDGTLVGKMMPNINSGLSGYRSTGGRNGI